MKSENGALLLIVIVGIIAYYFFSKDKGKSLSDSLQNIWNGPKGYVLPNDPSRFNNSNDPILDAGSCQ